MLFKQFMSSWNKANEGQWLSAPRGILIFPVLDGRNIFFGMLVHNSFAPSNTLRKLMELIKITNAPCGSKGHMVFLIGKEGIGEEMESCSEEDQMLSYLFHYTGKVEREIRERNMY